MSKLNLRIIKPDHSNIISVGYSIFMAGGISNCRDWHAEYINQIKTELSLYTNYIDDKIPSGGKLNVTLLNPRRTSFDLHDKAMTEDQIKWEFNMLNQADLISFWFSNETLCPITLYELGYWLGVAKDKVIIGVDDNYQRIDDVKIQSRLAGYDKPIFHTVSSLVCGIVDHLDHKIDVGITPF